MTKINLNKLGLCYVQDLVKIIPSFLADAVGVLVAVVMSVRHFSENNVPFQLDSRHARY